MGTASSGAAAVRSNDGITVCGRPTSTARMSSRSARICVRAAARTVLGTMMVLPASTVAQTTAWA
ncbi:hypothetical protein ACRS6B_13415 [Nocardia asteroides]